MFLGKKVRISCEHAQKLHSKAMEGEGQNFREGKVQGLPEGCNPTTFEGMKMFLLREYTPRNAVGSAVKSLKKIKQKPNEKVNPYYWRLVAQVERVSRAFDSEGKKDYVTTSDDHLTKIFIKGLREKAIRIKVREREPTTMVQARVLAEKAESVFSEDESDSGAEEDAAALVEPTRRWEEKMSRTLKEWQVGQESNKKKNKRKKRARKSILIDSDSSSATSSEEEKSDSGGRRMGTRSQAGNRKGKKGGSSSNNSTLSVMTAGDQKEVIERLERKEREVRELQQKLKMKEQLNAFSERLGRVEGEKQALAAMLQGKTGMHPDRVAALNTQGRKRPYQAQGKRLYQAQGCWKCGDAGHRSFSCRVQVTCANCGRNNHMTQECRHEGGQKQLKCFACGDYGHPGFRCLVAGNQRPTKFPRGGNQDWKSRTPQRQNFQQRQSFQHKNFQRRQNFQPTGQQAVQAGTQFVPQAAFTSMQQEAAPVSMLGNQSFVQVAPSGQTSHVLVPAQALFGGSGQVSGQPVTAASTIALEQKLETLTKQVETLQGNNLNRLGQ
jgi:uncharacterized protein (UPF0335 family)